MVVRALEQAGALVDDIEVRQPSLEDVLFSLTGCPAGEVTTDRDEDVPLCAGAPA